MTPSTEMRRHVFISYSEKDKTSAEMLLVALEKCGTPCWIAPRDIPPGGSYADAIMRAIEECACFVLVYTDHSNRSPHVLREVERALKFERNIIPVRFDQSEPSRSLDYLLATVHWLSIDPTAANTEISRVANQISACVPSEATKAVPPLLQTASPASPRKASVAPTGRGISKIVVLSLIIGLLIAGAILFNQFVSRKSRLNKTSEVTVAESKSTPPPTTPLATSSAPPKPVQEASPEASASATAVVAAKPAQQPAKIPARGTPEDTLQRYFACFGERDPSAAYNLLSSGFRSAMSFKKYSAMFSSTREMKVDETNRLDETGISARVSVRFTEIGTDYHQTYWQGPIELVREGGEWRIKTLRELKKVAAPPAGDTSQPESHVAGASPIRLPDKTWEQPHIYLQLANETQRTAALDLKRRLTQLRCNVVAIQSVSGNVDVPSVTSELRYFSTGDAAEAKRLANEMKEFFGSTGIIAYLPEGMPYVSHSRQYEIWFSSAFYQTR